jgi:hypothetical protein
MDNANHNRKEYMEYHPVLAKYYLKWFRDSHDSAVYCKAKGLNNKAAEYLVGAKAYFDIINENWDAIEAATIKEETNDHQV